MGNKMKTNRGAAKRFRKTASGKIKIKRAKMRHILTKKSTKMKRKARKAAYLSPQEEHLVNRLIPYK
ncbi:MAG: 50S ribosomal protein L35 [Alphaproteobacteria bacterium]|nr:50S ribosomal protein L35 [Alphaproteobacteria bacterium]